MNTGNTLRHCRTRIVWGTITEDDYDTGFLRCAQQLRYAARKDMVWG